MEGDYVFKKVANATKIFQREYKKQKTDVLEKIRKDITIAESIGDLKQLSHLDGVFNEIMQTICQEEAEKMQTFSLLHYKKPSKAMIDLEKKIRLLFHFKVE